MQLCGCRVQPAHRYSSEETAGWCHGYDSRCYASLLVRIIKDSNSGVRPSHYASLLGRIIKDSNSGVRPRHGNGGVPRCNAQAAEASSNEVHGRWSRWLAGI